MTNQIKAWERKYNKLTADQKAKLLEKSNASATLVSLWRNAQSLEERWLELNAVAEYTFKLMDEIESMLKLEQDEVDEIDRLIK